MSTDAILTLTRTRGADVQNLAGWLAPAFSTTVGEEPARAYLEPAVQGDLLPGDAITAAGITYAVESVGWWPPDSIEAVLAGANLADTGKIERLTGSSFDAALNVVTQVWSEIWTGPCDVEVGQGVLTATLVDNAGEPTVVQRGFARIPASVVDVEPGDRFTVLTSLDARLIGDPMPIMGVQMDTSPGLRVLNLSELR